MAGRFDGTIKIDSSIDSKGFNKGIDGMTGLVKKLGAALAVAFSIKVIATFTASVTKLSAEWQRLAFSAQAVGQIHGFAAEGTRKLVEQLKASGIQADIANRSYINFVKDGLDTALLPALAQGAQDLNVFSDAGESSSDVLNRLTNGILTLNSLVLRRAGVAIDIDATTRAAGATTVLEKRQAVLLAVTEKLRGVNGLYELSQKSAAGQLASNIRVTNDLKNALGAPLQNAFFILIKAWNTLLKAMTAAISEGGKLHDTFIRIGATASILAQIIARLFTALASLFGIKGGGKAMEELAAGSEEAAAGQKKVGEETKKAGKAAEGALASFDDLDVLQKNEGAGAGEAAGPLEGLGTIDPTKFTNPMDEIIAKAEEMKKALLDNELFIAFGNFFGSIEKVLKSFGDAILVTFRPAWEWFDENVLGDFDANQTLLDTLDWLTKKFEDLSKWIDENQKLFIGLIVVLTILGLVMSGLGFSILVIVGVLAALFFIVTNFEKGWKIFIDLIVLAWQIMTKVWIKAKDWFFDNVIQPIGMFFRSLKKDIVNAFIDAWERIKFMWGKVGDWFSSHVAEPIRDAFVTAFQVVENIVKSVMNRIIDFMNSMIAGVILGINNIIGAANSIGSIIPGYNPIGQLPTPQIPRLATGAVIPPNAEFAAILGDQTSGRNIEAPENLIRQIVREETAGLGGGGDVVIRFEGSLAELGRILKPVIDKEGARVGSSLIRGGSLA